LGRKPRCARDLTIFISKFNLKHVPELPAGPDLPAPTILGYRCRQDISLVNLHPNLRMPKHAPVRHIFLHGRLDASNAVGLSLAATTAQTNANRQQPMRTRIPLDAGIAALAETLADSRHRTESNPCHLAADRSSPTYADLTTAPI
jgi:hypothetical protein